MTLESDEVELLAQHFRALTTPATELGFDPTAEVGDEVFPHDTIGSHFGNGGGLDPAAGGDVAPGTRTVCERCGKAGLFFCDHVSRYNDVHPPLAQSVDPVAGEALREKVARLIAAGNHGDPWWWKQAFDDGSDETAVRLRADDVSVADTILAALAHPPHPAPVDPVAGGEALREALRRARDYLLEVGNDYPGSSCQKWCAEKATEIWNTLKPWEHCPSTHCERAQQCRSPNECSANTAALKGPAA